MNGYTPVGDLIVVSICFVMLILLAFSYNSTTKSFMIFLGIIGSLIMAAYANVSFNKLVSIGDAGNYGVANVIRCIYHALLFTIFLLFVAYITESTRLGKLQARRIMIVANIIWIITIGSDIVSAFIGYGVHITERGVEFQGADFFLYGYLAYITLLFFILFNVKDRLYRRAMYGFYGSIAVSFVMMIIQSFHRQSSFTLSAFLYPVIAIFYVMHSNPYDVQLGAVDARIFEDKVKAYYSKGEEFFFMSLYLHEVAEGSIVVPDAMRATIRGHASSAFRGAMLCQASKGHSILLVSRKRNPDYNERINLLMNSFYDEYRKYHYDYKIVIGDCIEEVSRENGYIRFIQGIHKHMNENEVHRIADEDIAEFRRREYIRKELHDIYQKRNLDDPRVLAYCQPVYNIRERRYDTAEALMRLQLEETGMVFPDQFIPLAEENDYIHVLTEIILHKTCNAVRNLITKGYDVSRVSVNVSVPELKGNTFCDDVKRIIDASGIPDDKIAIELTESQSEDDFNLMKTKINDLKGHGIKFYLDDFGTGYSNMERIMELPFDIIKFDRSLVLACDASARSREIVSSLANMFARMKYSVLYEGVENEADERMCMGMDASFLQGYKYSRPIPIEKLAEYMSLRKIDTFI
ncbi:MAG: EAL domain-containing protein [Lachnospiraceae bacterium]|nr:EAL domain-containing protein [Lachnospiraceae bacterium]